MDIIVSWSEIDTFRQCPFKHELSYKERWREPTTSPALARGTAWHALMEEHYRLKQLVDKGEIERGDGSRDRYLLALFEAASVRHGGAVFPPDEVELLYWMLEGYLDQWVASGADDDWQVLAVEVNTTQLLPGQAPRARKRFFLKTKIDLVVAEKSFGGKRRVVDHKSGKDLPRKKQLDLEDQFKLYDWVLKTQGKRIFGQLYNAARTQRNKSKPQPLDERFSRDRLASTPQELENVARDALRTAQRAYAIKPGEADRATDSDRCGWRCGYTEPCLFGRATTDQATRVMLRDKGYVQDFTRH